MAAQRVQDPDRVRRAGPRGRRTRAPWPGVATALVEAIAADAQEHGIELLALEVRGYNHTAIRIYERLGWRRTGKWENAVAVGDDRYDVILMARELVRPPGVRLHGEAA